MYKQSYEIGCVAQKQRVSFNVDSHHFNYCYVGWCNEVPYFDHTICGIKPYTKKDPEAL